MAVKFNRAPSFLLPFLLAIWLLLLQVIQSSRLGDPYSVETTRFEQTATQHKFPTNTNPYWGPKYKAPYPTNAWWMNLIFSDNEPIKSFPFMIRAVNGFSLCYPERRVTQWNITEVMSDDLVISVKEDVGLRKVLRHDALSVTVEFQNPANSSMRITSPIVRGQAYHTVEYANYTPVLTSRHKIIKVNGQRKTSPHQITSRKLTIELDNGQYWIVYSSMPITWTLANSRIVSEHVYSGVLRAAFVLKPDTHEHLFDKFSTSYPVSSNVKYSVGVHDNALIQFSFEKKGSAIPLLMFTLPHHRDILTDAQYTTPRIVYRTIKGDMHAIIGDVWTMKDVLIRDIAFNSRHRIPDQYIATISSALDEDKSSIIQPDDPYFGGKAIARLGRLAVIADELGQEQTALDIRLKMKVYFNRWLNINWTATDNKFIYERTYGGIVSKGSIGSRDADFGNYYYNDHHFHYGYWVYAAACIGVKDKDWARTNRDKIVELARDFANPSHLDPSYTVLRHMDWFVGHSYASGLFSFQTSRNQESTSEAVNAYYGLYLLGLVYSDNNMRDMGRLLLQTEIRSSQKYWQVTQESDIYDPVFRQNKCVGIMWETKVEYTTWFGSNVEFIHGIQMLPFTPISEELLQASWIQQSYPVFSTAYNRTVNPASDGWKGILYQAQAIIDPRAAARHIATLKGYDDGNTKTNTLYWLYTRPNKSRRG